VKRLGGLVVGLLLMAGAQFAHAISSGTEYVWEEQGFSGAQLVTEGSGCSAVSEIAYRQWAHFAEVESVANAARWAFSGSYGAGWGASPTPYYVGYPGCEGAVSAVNDFYTLTFYYQTPTSWTSWTEDWTLVEVRNGGEIVDWDLVGPLLTAVLGLWACAWLFVAIRKAL